MNTLQENQRIIKKTAFQEILTIIKLLCRQAHFDNTNIRRAEEILPQGTIYLSGHLNENVCFLFEIRNTDFIINTEFKKTHLGNDHL